eukprot:GHVU01097194.1.p2 GENE.GHVU01097194.1~~GHVU01097194.1.p2  ORF type:complete len:128 (-),score=5.41 GHVU01097194.1:260-643(-)
MSLPQPLPPSRPRRHIGHTAAVHPKRNTISFICSHDEHESMTIPLRPHSEWPLRRRSRSHPRSNSPLTAATAAGIAAALHCRSALSSSFVPSVAAPTEAVDIDSPPNWVDYVYSLWNCRSTAQSIAS